MTLAQRDTVALVEQVFVRLRSSGFQLGIEEYLAGLALVGDLPEKRRCQRTEPEPSFPFAQDLIGLKQSLKLLWCSSRSEQGQFEPIWEQAIAAVEINETPLHEEETQAPISAASTAEMSAPQRSLPEPPPRPAETETASAPVPDVATQPVRSPFSPAEIERPSDLQRYWPVSRRSMSYGWRYLRRTVAEGPAELIDVAETVQQTAQQGFYLRPVMQQRRYNRAQLLLLIDQNGSMMPLHQFTREIVETAQYESNLPAGQVTVCYFQNVPAADLYRDAFLTQPVALTAVLAACDSDTSVLVVSDAGAGRGYRRLERIRATAKFLQQLRQTTQLCAWLNPMPTERWAGSSAEMIAKLVPMFQMDDDGLSDAIDVVRGLPVRLR